jgi:hypothetical protein
MAGTPFKEGPEFVGTSSDNIYNPAANTYALVRQIHLVNQDSSARTVSLWVGATGAEADGTEILEEKSIPANDYIDLYFPGGLKLVAADFLTGTASAASQVVVTVSGELYAV